MTMKSTTDPDEARFALFIDGETIYSHTVSELLTALVAGYSDDHDVALEQRWRLAVVRANALQADLAVRAVEENHHLMGRLSEEQLTALFSSRAEVIDAPATWDCTIPLVLIATDYEPYTDRPAPQGNVHWIDPADERSLLLSLTAAGDLAFFTREDTP